MSIIEDENKLQVFMEQLNLAIQSTYNNADTGKRKRGQSYQGQSDSSSDESSSNDDESIDDNTQKRVKQTPYGKAKITKAEAKVTKESQKTTSAIAAQAKQITQLNTIAATANSTVQQNDDVGDNTIAITTFDISTNAYGNDIITKDGATKNLVLQ